MHRRGWYLDFDFSNDHTCTRVQLIAQLLKIRDDRLADVRQRLFIRGALGDAPRQSRNFNSVAPFLGLTQSDEIFDPLPLLACHTLKYTMEIGTNQIL